LEHDNWTTWPNDEQEQVRIFILAWWRDMIKTRLDFDQELFTEAFRLLKDVDALLDRFELLLGDESIFQFARFVLSMDYNRFTKEMDLESEQKLRSWVKSKEGLIEQAYFYYGEQDVEKSEVLADALVIITYSF
jgi:hypothetical protein